MLTRRLIGRIAFPLFAFTAGALALAGCRGHHGWHSSPEERADHVAKRIAKELDLNDDQKARLDKIKGDILSRKEDFRSLHAGMRAEALSQLRSGAVDQEKLNQSLEQREAKAKELRAFLVTEFAEFHALLDQGQRDKLAARLEKMGQRCH
jgi:periplasmic protein CpxP/Spy